MLRVPSHPAGHCPGVDTRSQSNKLSVCLDLHGRQSICSAAAGRRKCAEQQDGRTREAVQRHRKRRGRCSPGCFHIYNKEDCRHASLCHVGTHAGAQTPAQPSIHDSRHFLSHLFTESINKRLSPFNLHPHRQLCPSLTLGWIIRLRIRQTKGLRQKKKLSLISADCLHETKIRRQWAWSHLTEVMWGVGFHYLNDMACVSCCVPLHCGVVQVVAVGLSVSVWCV